MQKKVLVVQDNIENNSVLCRILEDEYDVIEVVNGKGVFDVIKAQSKNLSAVIFDLVMPVISGKELLVFMKGNNKYDNIPILIVTGEYSEQTETECLALGAWDFIAKPYGAELIKMRLKNIIARSKNVLLLQIQELSQKDKLTGIYNKMYFMERTNQMLISNPDEQFVLIRMDIDHFRLFNSSFGSDVGNKLLQKLAKEIIPGFVKCQGEKCTFGRIESDVFCICAPYKEKSIITSINAINEKLQSFSNNYRIKASFGLYVIKDNKEDMEVMYTRTVEATAQCKHNMNVQYSFYTEKMSVLDENEQKYTNEIDRALSEKQFRVYLQPKYSVGTEKPCGAEALVRWKHPELGMISPGVFIPVFEHNGLIVQVDYYMWESVCQLLSEWQKKGKTVWPVSVNISRISMYNPNIVEEIYALTQKYNIATNLLNLEITESAYMSNPNLMEQTIEKFRKLGFVILMDDFGSGYSSLNTLKNIEVDILKIDMKFLPTGHNNMKSEKILASIVRMADWLGVPVIVEGVETKEQRDFLESIGCDFIQGYYYARPMPVQEYEKLMDEQKVHKKEHYEISKDILRPFDDLLSSDSANGTLLRSVAVPFSIIEYENSKIDILRKNEQFQKEFSNASIDELLSYKDMSKLVNKIDEILLFKENGECDIMFTLPNGVNRWHHVHIIYIGTIEKVSLLSMILTDVTEQKKMEREINHIFNSLEKVYKKRDSILIVDDSEISRDILSSLFEEDYKILSASNGEEAIMLLKAHCNDIAAILLDIVMPKMNGEEFLEEKNRLKSTADIPVIVISSATNEKLQINMLEQGVNDYVTKPFIPAVVSKRVKNVIDYNSRFRHLVMEYNQKAENILSNVNQFDLGQYSNVEIKNMLDFMKNIFDVARLVDPIDTAIVHIDDGKFVEEPYSCFKVLDKNERCENCTGICSFEENSRKNKFERMKDNIFYVVSKPVEVFDKTGEKHSLVLEVVSKVSDENIDSKEEISHVFKQLTSIQ